MPHSGDDLGNRRVVLVQLLDKSDDVGSVLLPLGIPIPSLSEETKEGGIAHVAHLLPMLVSGIPREVGNETGLKDLVNWGFFT